MNKEQLVSKELSNLYAISKQVNQYFAENEINFLSVEWQRILDNYKKFSRKNEERIKQTLRVLEINPGNTKDSIIQEITENLREIDSNNADDNSIKQMGYVMSLNRLINYHSTNIINLDYLGGNLVSEKQTIRVE